MSSSKNRKNEQVTYSPWLRLDDSDGWDWEDSTNNDRWVCYEASREWFNLPSKKECLRREIRVRVSATSQGDDYQVVGRGYYFKIESSEGAEFVLLWNSLAEMLYVGCWIGLEIRKKG